MSIINKMISAEMTVVELKAAAKAHGFKGYSNLRKPELLQLFDNIIDAPVPNIQVPTLTPSSYVPTANVQRFYDGTQSAINRVANWILSYKPPEPIVNEKIEALKTTVNTLFNKLKSLKFKRVNQPSRDLQNNTQ